MKQTVLSHKNTFLFFLLVLIWPPVLLKKKRDCIFSVFYYRGGGKYTIFPLVFSLFFVLHKTTHIFYNIISLNSLFFNINFTIYNNEFEIYIPSFWNHKNTLHLRFWHFHRTRWIAQNEKCLNAQFFHLSNLTFFSYSDTEFSRRESLMLVEKLVTWFWIHPGKLGV